MRDMHKTLLLAVLTCVLLGWIAQPAAAVILRLKNQDAPIRGYLVREDANVVIVAELLPDGTTSEHAVLRSEIKDVVRLVSDERLAALQPENPDGYRDYADELSAKREDPDAQLTALRLYQIAAHLAPERLGQSCVASMIPLARSVAEERSFRAMAYLLDPAHDRSILRAAQPQPARSTELEPRQVEGLLKSLRALRQGDRREALALARRYKLKDRLSQLTDAITDEEFEQACAPMCPHCTHGRQPCPECGGSRFVAGVGGSRVACTACGARGDVPCSVCGGNYRSNPLPRSLLTRILRVELHWADASDSPDDAMQTTRTPWSRTVQQGDLSAAPHLTLETLTEFDPRQSRFQDGRWR
jgi:hypothetical protein